MRRTFRYWFLGLVSVGLIAGCGSTSDCREQHGDGGCALTSRPEIWSTCQATHPASTPADTPSVQGRSGFAWFENAEEEAPPHPQAIVTAMQVPESTPASKPVKPTAIEQFEIVQPAATPPTAPVQASWGTVTEMEKTQDSKSLAGRVQQYRNTWRLRYAPIDQEDVYGGVVILDGGAELSQLRDGQRVRVSGVLVPPESRAGSACYRVQAIEILD